MPLLPMLSLIISMVSRSDLNDLTQLTLGLDRDSALVAGTFDERDPAVKFLISSAIKACKARGKYIGICGQGPSDHPDLAEWLLEQESTASHLILTPWSTPGSDLAAVRGGPIPDPVSTPEGTRTGSQLSRRVADLTSRACGR